MNAPLKPEQGEAGIANDWCITVQAYVAKMVGYLTYSKFCAFMDASSISVSQHALADIQPSLAWSITCSYYMANSASGQDEPNRAL